MNSKYHETSRQRRYVGDDATLVEHDDEGRFVNTMVSYARTVNKMFTRHTCRLCHIYADKQVAFEVEEAIADQVINPVERAVMKMDPVLPPEVEIYRRYLFDEDSVIQTVGSRVGETE